jgi:predicted phosphoadenosine phosphosulfate sulfurtransferase
MKEKILSWVEKWEGRGYSNGIPDEAPPRLEVMCKAPSYRMICMAIMKNDSQLETLGYSRTKCEAYSNIKREELIMKGKIKRADVEQAKLL